MSGYKLLIDTNVFIGLEDSKEIGPEFSELSRKCSEYSVRILVHEAAVEDISHDADKARRAISLSKLAKFELLHGVPLPPDDELRREFGSTNHPNDRVDVALLHSLRINAIDFLVTQDQGIHSRVRHRPLSRRVLTVEEALTWLRQTFDPTAVNFPFIDEKRAHQLDPNDEIFDSLREDYVGFDAWWRNKCVKEHRFCWTISVNDELGGIVVRKDEVPAEAETKYAGDKILKMCTFKVKSKFRGEKFGELLLKQFLWFAQRNDYDLVYLTAFPKQAILLQILEYFGFDHTANRETGEMVYEKVIRRDRLLADPKIDLFTLDRLNYPRFVSGAPAQAFCVPIQGSYHRKLFPEIANMDPLPLFPEGIDLAIPLGDRTSGNTIRKVYLCRAMTSKIKAGDILLFYRSKSRGFTASQSLTSRP